MGWLLLWCAIGLLFVATMAGCLWSLWRKGRALALELAAQGRSLAEVWQMAEELGLAADRSPSSARFRHDTTDSPSDKGEEHGWSGLA